MQEANLYKIFISGLNKANIKYMVTGSLASIIYGEPRTTHDIDLVVSLKEKDIVKLSGTFPQSEFYFPPVEVIKIEILKTSRGHFNIIHFKTGFKADVYLLEENELSKWGMENAKEFELEGEKIFAAPPEYVIIMKMNFYFEGGSEKHIRDIKSILKYSMNLMDVNILNKFIRIYNLQSIWEKISNEET